MKTLFASMAVKNLNRHRRRTVITAIAIGSGVAIFIGFHSLMAGFIGGADQNMKEFEVGSAAFAAEGYWDEREQFPLDMMLDNPDVLLKHLDEAGIPAAPRTAFRGELIVHYDPYPEDGSLQIGFLAIDPQRDPEVFRQAESVETGRWLQSGEEIIIGRWLADQLGAEVGYSVSVTTRTRDGYRQLMELEIVGIYQTGNPLLDRHNVFVPQDLANEFLELRGAVTTIFTSLPEHRPGGGDLEPLRQIMDSGTVPEHTVLLSYQDMTSEFAEITQMQESASGIMMFLLAVIAVVGISNTMLMSVLERQKEIGMMRAMGFRRWEVRRVFMIEGASIAVLGSVVGLALGMVFVWLLTEFGINYDAFMEGADFSAYRFEGVLYGVWDFTAMLQVTLFAIGIAAVVALFPIRRVLNKEITECLRHG